MKDFREYLKWIGPASLLLAGLLLARAAAADSDVAPNWQDTTPAVPAAQWNGWFFNSGSQPSPAPSDPSQPWTSAENIALINSWQSLAAEGDEGWNAENLPVPEDTEAAPSAQDPVLVPEPVTFTLVGSGLALLAVYAFRRRRGLR